MNSSVSGSVKLRSHFRNEKSLWSNFKSSLMSGSGQTYVLIYNQIYMSDICACYEVETTHGCVSNHKPIEWQENV